MPHVVEAGKLFLTEILTHDTCDCSVGAGFEPGRRLAAGDDESRLSSSMTDVPSDADGNPQVVLRVGSVVGQ